MVRPSETAPSDTPSCRMCQAGPAFQEIRAPEVYGAPSHFHFWQCRVCRIVYLYPTFTPEEERRFYEHEFERFMAKRSGRHVDWSGPEEHVLANQEEKDRRIALLGDLVKPGLRVLEVGCSSGFLLEGLRALGMDVFGVEPSGVFAEYVKTRGIPVYDDQDAFRRAERAPVDLVLHYYVLEHIRDPLPFLQAMMDVLRDEGVMAFEVPSVSDPLISLYQIPAFDKFYWSVAHYWYFSRETLAWLLDRLGWEYDILPEQRYDLSNHMVWMMTGKPGGKGRFSHIFSRETERAYAQDLKRHWLCDTLFARVTKRSRSPR